MVWNSKSESTSYTTLQNRPKRQFQSANTIRNARYKPLPLKEHRLPLHFAIHNKLSSEVRCLVEEGCNVDARDLYKRTPLMLCCLENDEEWSSGVAMMLLQAGANASFCDSNGRNALMFAVIFSRKKIIDLLLVATDYNIYQRDANRRTALHYALMRGDEKTVDRITDACERQNKASMPKLLEFVQKDIRKHALPRHHTTPPEPCKSIMMAERSHCRIHRSSSDMNVHQFRRGTMRKFVLRSAKRRRSGSVDSVSSSSSSSDGISLISFSRQRSIHSALPYSSHASPHSTGTLPEFKSDAKNSERKESWKSSVPALWRILTIQCCPSYRRSVKPRFQTFEAALGLPPKEPEDEDKDLATIEMVDSNSNDLSPPRRSSMPTPASPPQALFLGRAERRRSEASVGLTAASLAKLFDSQQKQSKRLEASKGELRLAKATLDSQVNLRTKTKEGVESTNDDKQTISVEGAPPQRPLSSSKTRSEAAIAKRPSRTSINRNRPGSALRQEPQKSTRSNSVPDIKVNNEVKQQRTSELANINTMEHAQVNTTTFHQDSVASESSKPQRTRLESPPNTKETNASNTSENKVEISQPSPRRTPRRPSILLRESVLADILEENEATESRVSNHRVSTSGLRCASAHVRGRGAGGRRHTR